MYCALIKKNRKNKLCFWKNCNNCIYFYEYKETNTNDNKKVDKYSIDSIKGKEKYL